jgi:hypothetical protein
MDVTGETGRTDTEFGEHNHLKNRGIPGRTADRGRPGRAHGPLGGVEAVEIFMKSGSFTACEPEFRLL